MREFIELLNRAMGQARFEMINRGTYTALELRNIYHREPMLFALANTRLREELVDETTTLLKTILSKHIIDDRLGNGLAFFLRGIAPLKVRDLALYAVQASVVLGPERVAKLFTKWEGGQPISFFSHVILSGVSIEKPLEIVEGIRLETMPMSSDQILAQLPPSMHLNLGIMDLAGKVKMTATNVAQSALFRKRQPTIEEWHEVSRHRIYSSSSLDLLCKALSLVCNSYVTWRIAWSSCDIWDAFGQRGSAAEWRTIDYTPLSPSLLDQQSLPCVMHLLGKWVNGKNRNVQTDLAISRWMRSKCRSSLADQFIELRIALEALYLKGMNDELGFRLANYGAWHLGASFQERRQYQEILRKAYNRASTAVHAGTKGYKQEDEKLLADAQDLCRKGILKRLEEQEEPVWNDLILGKEVS